MWLCTTCFHSNALFAEWIFGTRSTQTTRSSASQAQNTLILVESPAKAKKIQNFLGPAYQVP